MLLDDLLPLLVIIGSRVRRSETFVDDRRFMMSRRVCLIIKLITRIFSSREDGTFLSHGEMNNPHIQKRKDTRIMQSVSFPSLASVDHRFRPPH